MAFSDRLQLRSAGPRPFRSSPENGLREFERARGRILVAAFVLVLLYFMPTAAAANTGKIGVDIRLKYGRGIISPRRIVELLDLHAISRARLFDANTSMLKAFANSGIDLIVSVPNEEVPTVARSPSAARTWVADHIVPFSATNISAILVGYEWLSDRRNDRTLLLPAIRNMNSALKSLGLARRGIKVSTSNSMDLLSRPSWVFPPSLATFKPSVTPILRSLLTFLIATESFFDFNISPYFAYVQDPKVSLPFVLFESTSPIRDTNTGLEYTNMFDVQADAINAAINALLGLRSTAADYRVSESLKRKDSSRHFNPKLNPSKDGHKPSADRLKSNTAVLGLDNIPGRASGGASIMNAQTFAQKLINHVFIVEGTPLNPSIAITAYMFELFNEELALGDATEKHLGLFYPNGTSVYPIDFCSPYL